MHDIPFGGPQPHHLTNFLLLNSTPDSDYRKSVQQLEMLRIKLSFITDRAFQVYSLFSQCPLL